MFSFCLLVHSPFIPSQSCVLGWPLFTMSLGLFSCSLCLPLGLSMGRGRGSSKRGEDEGRQKSQNLCSPPSPRRPAWFPLPGSGLQGHISQPKASGPFNNSALSPDSRICSPCFHWSPRSPSWSWLGMLYYHGSFSLIASWMVPSLIIPHCLFKVPRVSHWLIPKSQLIHT